jgi:hypothetical protein
MPARAPRETSVESCDNTDFLYAAEALEREADTVHAHVIDDADVPSMLRDIARRFRAIASASATGKPGGPRGWPQIEVIVRGTSEPVSYEKCAALRGPERYQPVCTLPAGHTSAHRWGRMPMPKGDPK